MTLYRKYRSQKLSELVGQPQIAAMLGQAIATQRIAHAYLFSGPRGTGKTSVARIMAKAINCLNESTEELPCNECANCIAINQGSFLDVVEIDAASHRGIDDVRELVEQVQSVPSIGRYKVYILDEVHMFTREAFNALLKTLEEPPAHVVMILCTTESHKVPVTIASRCQRFVFNGATQEQLQQLLERIAAQEGVKIDAEAVMLLAQLADGGYRDGVMLLDQILTSARQSGEAKTKDGIYREDVEQQLGLANLETVQKVIEQLVEKNPKTLIETIEQFSASGGEARYLAAGLIDMLRNLLFHSLKSDNLAKKQSEQQQAWMTNICAQTTTDFLAIAIKDLVSQPVNSSIHPTLAVELSLLETITSQSAPAVQAPAPIQRVVAAQAAAQPSYEVKKAVAEPVISSEPKSKNDLINDKVENKAKQEEVVADTTAVAAAPVSPPSGLAEAWQQTLVTVFDQNKSVGALLRHHCTPVSLDGTILLLQFWNAFHKKQVELDKNRLMVEEIATTVFGHPVKIRGELADKSLRPKKKPMTEEDLHNIAPVEPDSDLVDTALEMFGGELVDEKQ